MKTFTQRGLILVLGIAYGQAFFLEDVSEKQRAMYACHLKHTVSTGSRWVCRDQKKVEMCLKKIVTNETMDKMIQQDLIEVSVTIRNECPGFVGTLICRHSETMKCMRNFSNKQRLYDDSICQELQEVRDCLVRKLNDSCSQKVIQKEIAVVDNVDQDCKAGNFNGGPCGTTSFYGCLAYLDDNFNEDSNFKCNDTLLANAKGCLSSLKSTCKTKDQQDKIKDGRKMLENSCTNY